MSNRSWAILATILVGLAFFAGYERGKAAGGPDGLLPIASRPGKPVAKFGGAEISLEELKAQIEEQPSYVRARYASATGKREYLDSVVRFELMAREAQKHGLMKDPEIIKQTKRNLVALFVQREFEDAQRKIPVADSELQKFYDDHVEDYVKPEKVRVADIYFDAPASDAKKRAEKKALAEATLVEARSHELRDFGTFGDLARQKTEDAVAKAAGGDLHFLTRDELAKRAGAEVAEAAFGLKDIGKLPEQIVETPQGFHVIKLMGRENALNLKLDDVREAIRNRILYDRRSQNYQKFLSDLEKQAGLSVDDKALEALAIDVGPGNPALGSIPPAPKARVGDAKPGESSK